MCLIAIESPDMEAQARKAIDETIAKLNELASADLQLHTQMRANSQNGVSKPAAKDRNWLAIALGGLTIAGIWFGTLKYVVSSEVGSALAAPNQRLATIEEDIKHLQSDVKSIQDTQSQLIFRSSSTAAPKEIGDAAQRLQQEKVALPLPVVAEAGRSVLKSAEAEQKGGWDATTRLMEYVSFINGTNFDESSVNAGATPSGGATYFLLAPPHSYDGSMFTAHRQVAIDEAALVGPIGQNMYVGGNKGAGPAFVLLKGGHLQLDGNQMKHAIVENAVVKYSGGAIQLYDVYFVNCTFIVDQHKNGLLLAGSMFSNTGRSTVSIS